MSEEVIVTFKYCNQCRWMLRTCWMAQELLSTFDGQITEVRLIPGEGGVFNIKVNEQEIWDRKEAGGFPDIKVLKQKLRDVIAPEQDLGHTDR